MDREAIKRVLEENVGKWVCVKWVDGGELRMYIVNVDDEGCSNMVEKDDMPYWATFSDMDEVIPEEQDQKPPN